MGKERRWGGSTVGHGGLPENFWRAANSTGGPPHPLNPSSTELKFSKVKSINGIFPERTYPQPGGQATETPLWRVCRNSTFPNKTGIILEPVDVCCFPRARSKEVEPHYFRPSAPRAHFRFSKLKRHDNMKTVC